MASPQGVVGQVPPAETSVGPEECRVPETAGGDAAIAQKRKQREVVLDADGNPLSRNAIKRLRRDQRWEEKREERREPRGTA